MIGEGLIDTNVLAISEGLNEEATEGCVRSCLELVKRVENGEMVVLLDEGDEILLEYLRAVEAGGGSGVGVRVARMLRNRKRDVRVCRRVPVTLLADNSGSYEEVPEEIRDFDVDDQKFFAVAQASGSRPKIYAGLDREWWCRASDLLDAGFDIQFRCSNDLMNTDC